MRELNAIYLSLYFGFRTRRIEAVIFVDSFSALQAIKGSIFTVKNHILYDIHFHISSLQKSGCKVLFEWIPSHVGICGNELADLEA